VVYKWMPIVVADRCTGCGLCVEACGPKSLAMVDGIAVLSFPDTCGSEEHCIAACREEAIQMAWLSFSGDRTVGRWNDRADPRPALCFGRSSRRRRSSAQ
jgi:Na+-translocating ferredoxin:NAD+ oxidoreductase RNF subunit RnfB